MNKLYNLSNDDIICSLATVQGTSAIAVIRVAGKGSIELVDKIFTSAKNNNNLTGAASHTIHYGKLLSIDGIIDEVLISVFKAPHSYTGEDIIEISCHGSLYIQKQILQLLNNAGARQAGPGEFTLRAFRNGKFDLMQAEAVADLISSNSRASHELAIKQMRGGFSSKIKALRAQLVDFSSLIELELDFSEEDVEFANRSSLTALLQNIKSEVNELIESFKIGNVMKTGIPVAIIGKPNVGKSTLLNAILNEEKAIVSDIPGTTRDAIEDTISINGLSFRFIDTAGLRDSDDNIESLGIERTYEKIEQAQLILYVVDISTTTIDEIKDSLDDFKEHIVNNGKKFIIIANKTDLMVESPHKLKDLMEMDIVFISAKRKENINLISDVLTRSVNIENISDNAIVSNVRHKEALEKVMEQLISIEESISRNISTDLLASDLRVALYHLGEITGEITNDEILGTIFGKFCIGK
jgi:tRNA modification GTPase